MQIPAQRLRIALAAALAAIVFSWAPAPLAASELERFVPTPEQLRGSDASEPGRAYKLRIEPHWLEGGARFWYRNQLPSGAKEFILVDAAAASRSPAFDHARLAAALSEATGQVYAAEQLPFDELEFTQDGGSVNFRLGDDRWRCDLESYECKRQSSDPNEPTDGDVAAASEASTQADESSPQSERRRRRFSGRRGEPRSLVSPNEQWEAEVREHNVFVRARDGSREFQLTQDGQENHEYGMLSWAPDSQTLVAFRIQPGDNKDVYRIESSPAEGGRARLHTRPYPLPGDKLTQFELNLLRVEEQRQIKPEVDPLDLGWPRIHWKKDGRHFAYTKVDRGHQRLRVIEVDSHTGQPRTLIDEQTDTFIWTAHAENVRLEFVNWLEETDEIIYASERDGWRHLYLVDAAEGGVQHPITQGEYVVRGIDHIDETKRQIWFHASGRHADQDPYFVHYYRVNFDGSGLVALTEGDGQHSVQFSPDREYAIDTYSRVDRPPVHELRRTSDGSLVCRLEEADITELVEQGWQAPEIFVAKGRDGQTDIWGIICRPPNFDPAKRYPVIEHIYAGPQGAFVPKSFNPRRHFSSLTDLGFIVVQIDGMGTAHRSKAFHDVCWKNLKDAGLPDRILWHQAVAAKYPQYDLERLGIYGVSAGGQNSTGALLFHPDVYKVGVSACGCHDNRMDKASWNEQWMGYPVGPHYAESSNIENAHRLQGKLLLIVGEMDDNVPPESTMRLADALIKANKDFDLLVVPGAGHGLGGPYGQRRMQDFFVRHLHGVEPPNRNQ